MEARHDVGFALSSLDVDVSIAIPISDQAWVSYTRAWESLVGEVASSVRF